MMNRNTAKLHCLGQRLWLDTITRELLNSGTLARCIAELSVTGLTSNPTIFEHALGSGGLYDEAPAAQLHLEGVQAFAKSCSALMVRIQE